MKNRSSGFTLIELIVVLAIIMILAGLTTGAALKAKQRAMIAQTKTMISGLETALGMFQMDIGGYPNSGTATNLVSCLTTLGGTYTVGTWTALTVTTTAGWSGPYMTFKQGDLNATNDRVIDAWGTVYTYTNPGATAHSFGSYVDISSNGPDKNAGTTGDNVTNWTR